MHIEPGAQTRIRRIVAEGDTAQVLGTGDVPVLATSRLVAWCEEATFDVMNRQVDPGLTSVAMRVQVDHVRAVTIGSAVTAIATLERIEGRRYVFVVSALDDENQPVAEGRIVRVLVETGAFLAKASGTGESPA